MNKQDADLIIDINYQESGSTVSKKKESGITGEFVFWA